MQHVATLTYSEPLVARAVRTYWVRSMGFSVLIAVAAVVGLLTWRLMQGDRSWVVGLLAAVAALGFVLPAAAYLGHYRNSMAKFREMGNPVATLSAEQASFTLASDVGTSTLKWTAVVEVWCFEKFWLFLFSKAQFATIPLDGMSPQMQTYVLERVKAAGGRVAV
jgi:hypothetical protein